MKIASIEKERNERATPCPFCGEAMHKGEYECPRIQSVTHNPETGEITIRFSSGFYDISSDGQRVAADR
jgi:tRNA(Ile2) C34 agmatinyltransferase TiaS